MIFHILSFNKPYAKLTQDLLEIRHEIQGQIIDIKKDLECEIKAIEQQIVNLKHLIISHKFIENDRMYDRFLTLQNL